MQRIIKYFRSVATEMKLVSWPGRNDVISATVLVVVFAVVMAMVVWGIDKIIELVIGLVL
ncbi:MAG: preprotein translocase subunit SecE [Chitinispirillales bacterium]|jgi:preprotein translocase subunit SecE|nr:preprotein translocase subunit SecE [Chitinispirillales bacterium]